MITPPLVASAGDKFNVPVVIVPPLALEYPAIAPTVVQVARNAPLPTVDLSIPKAPKDLSEIYQFKERYGLGASVDRLISALGW